MPSPARFLLLTATLAAAAAPVLRAQDLITNVNVNVTTPLPTAYTTADTGPLTYENATEQLTGFTTSSGSYNVGGTADYSLVQRNGATNQSSLWYDSGTGNDLKGVHRDTYGAVLKSNNFYEGSDNTFSNDPSATGGNIERLDFTWKNSFAPAGLSTLAFAVFDRGDAGAHDAFTIALVTGIDATGKPTSYGAVLKVAGGWGGTTNPLANQGYHLLRYSTTAAAPDATTASNSSSEVGTQGVGGLVIKVSSFAGLPANTPIYGYSLLGYDVVTTNLNNLLDVTNSNGTITYPTDTTGATGTGGIDLAAVNGLEIRAIPVPEPGTCGALLALAAGGWLVARRQRRA